MLDSIVVDDAVVGLRPDFAVLLMVADGLSNAPSDRESVSWLAEATAAAVDPAQDPHVAAWQDAYRGFGAKPQRTRPSVDALLRRASTGLPQVNRVVDAYNTVSVRHVLPIGGEDLDAYDGPARLVRANGGEPFDTTADGLPTVVHPDPGEVVWRDDTGVTCRRWNWRQCVRTQITEHTKNALFILERLEPMPIDRLESAGAELADLLRAITPEVGLHTRLIAPGL